MYDRRIWWLHLTLVCVVSAHLHPEPHTPTRNMEVDEEDPTSDTEDYRLAELYLPVHVGSDTPCGRALTTMFDSLADNSTFWAARMVDSWGKSGDGVLVGMNTLDGMFDECVTTSNPNDTIKGKYCQISLRPRKLSQEGPAGEWIRLLLGLDGHPPVLGLGGMNGLLNVDTRSAAIVPHTQDLNFLYYGTCMPHECTREQLAASLLLAYKDTGVLPHVFECDIANPDLYFTASDICFICVVAILSFVVVTASVLDLYITYSGNKTFAGGWFRFLLPFSAYTNLSKIFHLNPTPSPTNITCLHGMRVLSMTWIFYCHQLMVGNSIPDNTYMDGVTERTSDFLSQIYLNGYSSVDTFFFLSGLLVTLSVLRQLNNTSKFNIIVFYLHRIIRLVPTIAMVCWMMATVFRFFITGPRSYIWNLVQDSCEQYWWRDVLMINNFFVDQKYCLSQSWYVSVDSQLYLVAPLLILPLFWYKGLGQAWLYLVTLASALIPAIIIYVRDLAPSYLLFDERVAEYSFYVYITPWCRAGPWIIGIWLGYVLHKLDSKKVKMSGVVVTVGWILATLSALMVVFGMWSYNTLQPTARYDIMTQLAYGSLSRIAWAASLAWVVFACQFGYGGMVNGFLSHPSWQPLSRLTFTIYLLSVQMQYAVYCTTRTDYYFTHLNKVIETVGALGVTLPVATLVSLLVEAPIIRLEKLLLSPESGQVKKTEMTTPEVLIMKENLPSDLDDSEPERLSQERISAYHNSAFTGEPNNQEKEDDSIGVTKF